jgi:hypothetical protein
MGNPGNGEPEFSTTGVGLADDVAAMIAPGRWPDLVMPYIEQYYRGLTSGKRSAHIEDMRVEHLKYLDELRISSYDPSVSPRLTPGIVRDNCRAAFSWRLNSMQYLEGSEQDIEQWVVEAAAGGASSVFTAVTREMCAPEMVHKVRAFIRAAKKVKETLDSGCPCHELLLRKLG